MILAVGTRVSSVKAKSKLEDCRPALSMAVNRMVWLPLVEVLRASDGVNENLSLALRLTGWLARLSTWTVALATPERLSITQPSMVGLVDVVMLFVGDRNTIEGARRSSASENRSMTLSATDLPSDSPS